MPPYTWIHLENVWWVLAGGLVVAAAIVLARATTTYTFTFKKRSDADIAGKEAYEFPGGVKEQNRPVPVLIWLVIIGYLVWAVLYVIFYGARGL